MIEFLEHIDQQVVLAINSWNTPFLDEVMWIISGKYTWVPLYLFLTFLAYRKLSLKVFVFFMIGVFIAIGLSDLISVELFKENIQRYRPSHHIGMKDHLHLYVHEDGSRYRGGQYGFVSSHAANFFALAIYVGLSLRLYYKWLLATLIFIACIIAYSRMYLGVHYLSDVLVGGLLGATMGYLSNYFIFKKISSQKI